MISFILLPQNCVGQRLHMPDSRPARAKLNSCQALAAGSLNWKLHMPLTASQPGGEAAVTNPATVSAVKVC